jgi:hypothetical protein
MASCRVIFRAHVGTVMYLLHCHGLVIQQRIVEIEER